MARDWNGSLRCRRIFANWQLGTLARSVPGQFEDNWLLGVRNALTLGLQTSIESLLEAAPTEAARLALILLEMEPFDAKVLRLTLNCLERSGNLKQARSVYAEGSSRLLEVGELLPETMDGFLTPQLRA